MANTFVATVTTEPSYHATGVATNTDAGNNDLTVNYRYFRDGRGLSIQTGTLTAMTVTILASNNDAALVDVTQKLAQTSALASDSMYIIDTNSMPFKKLVIRSARTNATNALDFTVFAPR